MGRVTGKSIIVTGAGSGIGEGFARIFGAEGAKVGVCDLNPDAAMRVASFINDNGGQAIALTADVSQRAQVAAAFKKFVDWAGSLDVLFNNAGFNKPMPLMEVTEENWNAIMNVNGLGTLIGVQEGGKYMIKQKSGKIINTASIAGRQGYPSFTPYCASKFAVNAITQATARALAQYNINPIDSGPFAYSSLQKDSQGNILSYVLVAIRWNRRSRRQLAYRDARLPLVPHPASSLPPP